MISWGHGEEPGKGEVQVTGKGEGAVAKGHLLLPDSLGGGDEEPMGFVSFGKWWLVVS